MKFFYNSFIRLYTKELVAIRLQELRGDYSLLKGRSVKYIRRIPTGQPKRPYIYIYASDSPEKRRAKLQYAKDLNQKRKPKDEKRQSTIFDTIANKIKSIFPSADPKKDFSDYEVNGGTLSKEEYAKIALDYFQNKEKYDKVAIKVKKEAGQEKPKVKRESKELTEEEIALKDKQKQRRLIIKQLKAKYGSTGVPTEMNIATIPEGKVGDYKTMPEGTIAYDQMKAEEEREVKEEIGEIPVENPSVGQPKEIKNKDHYKNKLKDVSLQRLNELEKFYENDFNSENIIGAIREIRQEKFPGTRADQIKEQKFSIPKNKKYSKNGEIYFTSEQVEQYKPEKEVKEIVSNGVSLGWSVNNLGKIPAQSGVRYYDEKEQAVNVARNLKQKVVDYIRDKDIHNFTETDSKGQPARTSGQASPTKDVKSDVVNVENKNQSSAPKETKVEVKQDKPINTETESGIEKQTFSNEEVKKISSQALRDIAKDNRPKVRMVINGIFTIAYKANISLKRVKKQLDELIQTAGGIPDDVAKTIVKTITGKELKSPQDLSTALKSFVESAYNTAWEKYRNTDVVKTNPKMFRDKREGEEKEVKEPIFNKSSFFLRKIQKGLKGSTGRNVKYKQRIPTGHKKTPYIYIYEDDTQDVVKRKKEQADALKREVKGKPLKQEKVQANNTQAENKKTVTKKIQIQVDPKKSIPDVVKELQVGDIVTMKNGIKFELLSSDSKGVKRKITFKDGSEEIRYTETKNIASIQGWVIDRSITETIIEEKQPEVEKPKKKDIKPEVVEQDSKPKEEPVKNNFETMPESKPQPKTQKEWLMNKIIEMGFDDQEGIDAKSKAFDEILKDKGNIFMAINYLTGIIDDYTKRKPGTWDDFSVKKLQQWNLERDQDERKAELEENKNNMGQFVYQGEMESIEKVKKMKKHAETQKPVKVTIPEGKTYYKNGELYFTSEQVKDFNPEFQVKKEYDFNGNFNWSVNNIGRLKTPPEFKNNKTREEAVESAKRFKEYLIEKMNNFEFDETPVPDNFVTMPESEPVKQEVKKNFPDYKKALKQKDNKAIFSKNLVSGLNIDPSVLYDWSKSHNVDIVWHAHILKNPANVESILDDINNNKFDKVKTLIDDYKNRKQEVSKPAEPPKNNFKTMPESKTTETPKPGGDGTSTLFGAESMPQSAWEQSEMFSDKQKFDATRKDFKPTIVLQTTNIDELTSSVKNALLKEGKTKDAKEFVDSTYKAGQGIEEVLTIASNYVNVQKPFSDSEISYKSIKAKIQLAKFDKDLTDTKRQYIDYQEEYLKHLEKSKKVFKDSKEISMYLLKEYDNYTGKGKTSDGFENTNFKKSTLQPPTKTAYRKEGDIKTQTNTGTVSDQANKQSVGQSKQIAVEKLKIKDQYTKKEHFDRPVIEGIKKSILENGFNPAFPITVDQDGYVVDGHHRASAVMELLEEGKVNKDFPVSIIQKNYTSEADRLPDQLSANEMRREVLILDKAKAYATLLKQGKTAEEIGARNNKSPADIKSIASLENLVPEIKQIITAEFMRDRKGKKPTGTVEEQETESFSIPVGVAVAIAKNGLNDDGTPNGTLQRKALNWFRENRQKGARGTQVASYIRELKEAQSGGFFTQEESTSASQRESMDIIGSEEKAKRNISSLQRMQTNIQKELTKIAGDNIQDVNKKVLKEIAASVIAIKGSADLMLAGLKTTLRDFELLIYGIEKASKEIESDAQTPTMFGKSKYSSYKFKPESKETILKLKKALIKLRLQALRLERSLELYE